MSHLNHEQLTELTRQVEAERLRLRTEIRAELTRSDSESYATIAGQVHDAGDESVADLLSDVNTAIISHSIKELREVEAAQERLREGRYGSCEVCGEPIPFERLRAYPAARLCLDDQQRLEAMSPAHRPDRL
ncbi:MAG: TraR/DksA C4-type zinc finger protein [Chromatiales bacterium]|nr:TraR/DksA C4-type zinc finger protein [Chromatiales bacterium]